MNKIKIKKVWWLNASAMAPFKNTIITANKASYIMFSLFNTEMNQKYNQWSSNDKYSLSRRKTFCHELIHLKDLNNLLKANNFLIAYLKYYWHNLFGKSEEHARFLDDTIINYTPKQLHNWFYNYQINLK